MIRLLCEDGILERDQAEYEWLHNPDPNRRKAARLIVEYYDRYTVHFNVIPGYYRENVWPCLYGITQCC